MRRIVAINCAVLFILLSCWWIYARTANPRRVSLNVPWGITVDNFGNVLVANIGDSVILKAGVVVAGNGKRCPEPINACGDGGKAVYAELSSPYGVAVDANGNIYIADTYDNRIRMVDSMTGVITTIAGTGIRGFRGDGGPATLAELDLPASVALDAAGNVYISDTDNNEIRCVIEVPGGCGNPTLPVGTIITVEH